MTEYEMFEKARERADKRLTIFITFAAITGICMTLYGVLMWMGVLQ